MVHTDNNILEECGAPVAPSATWSSQHFFEDSSLTGMCCLATTMQPVCLLGEGFFTLKNVT